VPWGASRAQVRQIMSERGWMRLDGASPSAESFKGAFNGMSSQLTFTFEGESFVEGTGDYLARVPERNIAFTTQKYEETVRNLTEKYGQPTESKNKNFGGFASWKIVDTNTADEYTIYALCLGMSFYDTMDGMKEKHSSFSITYTAESLKKRLSKQGI